MTSSTVAVLGTGIMGAGMARSLLREGIATTVWNRSPEKAKPLADDGATVADTAAEAVAGADVVLMGGDLRGVVNALALSRATLRNIRQNLAWAFGYNVILIPVAAGALAPALGLSLSPMVAAGAMALSSVSVLFNALRLRAFTSPLPAAKPRTPPK